MRAIICLLMLVSLAACGEDYQGWEKRLVSLVSEKPGGPAYWLEQRGDYFPDWYKVSLVYGFGGQGINRQVCQEIADNQNTRARVSPPKYRCVEASLRG